MIGMFVGIMWPISDSCLDGLPKMIGRWMWPAMLSYTADGYAYYVFGPSFNDLFLLHVAIFTLAIVALGFGLGALDTMELTPRFSSVWLPRVVAGFL